MWSFPWSSTTLSLVGLNGNMPYQQDITRHKFTTQLFHLIISLSFSLRSLNLDRFQTCFVDFGHLTLPRTTSPGRSDAMDDTAPHGASPTLVACPGAMFTLWWRHGNGQSPKRKQVFMGKSTTTTNGELWMWIRHGLLEDPPFRSISFVNVPRQKPALLLR